ncbi:DeoR faimly transcriptional regulator [Streptomyces sp. 150FB]|jgi:DeoR/GlpR family transcriptional regulator of sugar metabolism|uniref:DeoR/GlpR family DNA-binding transcription regulator n=1 Tax=Streptomyces sp. 150FB TaxID=1576605 RepID=UPI0005892C10|nr:DeoR/GlpR family DNA-binding transcription regulator [Streptomyces sp. 150FB]KIF77202.1 DeoR faimly transcriptional regulator [Streptomyces sp. 150FB]
MTTTGTAGGSARPQDSRRQLITEHVLARGTSTVSELSEMTGVSVMTVHRDLDELARRGVLRRFRGGVSALPSTVFESNLDYRLGVNVGEKAAIAVAAAELVEPGMSVMLDDSTTALALARLLAGHAPLTVVSNARRVIDVCAGRDDIRLIALGGEYSQTHDSFLGVPCVEAVEALSVDLVVVSTSAMDAQMTYHQEQDVVLVKRAMLASGTRKALLMDRTKLARTALHRLAPVADFDHLVVDASVGAELVAELRERTDVRVAAAT